MSLCRLYQPRVAEQTFILELCRYQKAGPESCLMLQLSACSVAMLGGVQALWLAALIDCYSLGLDKPEWIIYQRKRHPAALSNIAQAGLGAL